MFAGFERITELLIKSGAELNYESDSGTALYKAAMMGRTTYTIFQLKKRFEKDFGL